MQPEPKLSQRRWRGEGLGSGRGQKGEALGGGEWTWACGWTSLWWEMEEEGECGGSAHSDCRPVV